MTNTSAFDRVIVAVFDGMRPDLVTPELTPNMLRVAKRGTWFRQARSVFPPVTRVATSSMASGAPPAVHGIVGNKFFHGPAFEDRIFDTSNFEHLARAEEVHRGRFLAAETFGDVLAKAGRMIAVVHTGSAGSTHLINPRAKANGHWTFSVNGASKSPTPDAVNDMVARFGPLPERELPKLKDATYAARVMTDYVLSELKPDAAVIWFNEPDTTFHFREIGSADARKAISHADGEFGRILDFVEAQPDADRTLVIVASDHGQIATSAAPELFERARGAGFALAEADKLDGAAFAVTGGRSGEVRLRNADAAALSRVADWLLAQEDVSHVFSRGNGAGEGAIAGTLPLDAVGLGHDRAPDLFFVLSSHLGPDHHGLPGLGLMTPGDVAVGGGQHGGLNPYELNSVLIVGHGTGAMVDDPAGIIDIGPTLLGALGLSPAPTMVGRNLLLEARDEPQRLRIETARQHVDVMDQDGRRFIVGSI